MRKFILGLLMCPAAAIAASERDLPPIAPPTEAAAFSGNGGAIKFDPSCRDYTLSNLDTNPSCAARVRGGETAPSIAIAARSVAAAADAKQVQAAITILENAIRAENHPATHYILGSVLVAGEKQKPDLPKGIKHLEIAASTGNAAAADLLGMLLLIGKGIKQDIPRAITMYEKALAGGFDAAAASLTLIYLQGRYIQADAAYGRRLLDATSKLGYKSVARIIPYAESANKSHNYQVEPSADPKQVRVVDFSILENPEIPPALGFTEAFRRVHYQGLSDQTILSNLQQSYLTDPTPNIFELARRMAADYPERAASLFLLGRIRITYDALRCEDREAMSAPNAWNIPVAKELTPIIAGMNGDQRRAAAQQALAEEAKMSADSWPWWVCYSGLQTFTDARQGKTLSLRLKPSNEWPKFRSEARQSLESFVSSSTER